MYSLFSVQATDHHRQEYQDHSQDPTHPSSLPISIEETRVPPIGDNGHIPNDSTVLQRSDNENHIQMNPEAASPTRIKWMDAFIRVRQQLNEVRGGNIFMWVE